MSWKGIGVLALLVISETLVTADKMIVKLSDIRSQPPKPSGNLGDAGSESAQTQQLIRALGLTPHVEGGYFVETDRDERKIVVSPNGNINGIHFNKTDPEAERSLSTSIIYCLTSQSPVGAFHRNRSRTVHTLHQGRGIYVILRENQGRFEVEMITIGKDVANGEKLQWIVEGGCYKASFLIPDEGGSDESSILLISEVCGLYCISSKVSEDIVSDFCPDGGPRI